MKNRKNTGSGVFLLLHLCLMISSVSGICAKMAGRQTGMTGFLLWYGLEILIMGIYAVFWQQILKKLPLTTAYANRPVSLIWGMIWGSLFFHERITWGMIVGAGVIFFGIWLVVTEHE